VRRAEVQLVVLVASRVKAHGQEQVVAAMERQRWRSASQNAR
jgi:hypothetical protein